MIGQSDGEHDPEIHRRPRGPNLGPEMPAWDVDIAMPEISTSLGRIRGVDASVSLTVQNFWMIQMRWVLWW